MEGLLEKKSIKGNVITDVDRATRTVTGYASVFGNKDFDSDIIVKGAFKKTITERINEIYYLYNHNWEKPLDKGSKNVKLYEDDYGLKFEAKITEGLTYGNDLILLYEEGIVDEHSIGFRTEKSHKANDARMLTELRLYEFSAVTMAANPMAKLEGIKSELKGNNDKVGKIIKMFRSGNLTDETYGILEIALKQIQLEAYELGKNTQSELEPSADTQIKSIEPLIDILKEFKI